MSSMSLKPTNQTAAAPPSPKLHCKNARQELAKQISSKLESGDKMRVINLCRNSLIWLLVQSQTVNSQPEVRKWRRFNPRKEKRTWRRAGETGGCWQTGGDGETRVELIRVETKTEPEEEQSEQVQFRQLNFSRSDNWVAASVETGQRKCRHGVSASKHSSSCYFVLLKYKNSEMKSIIMMMMTGVFLQVLSGKRRVELLPGDRDNLAIQTRGGPEKHEVTGWVLVRHTHTQWTHRIDIHTL